MIVVLSKLTHLHVGLKNHIGATPITTATFKLRFALVLLLLASLGVGILYGFNYFNAKNRLNLFVFSVVKLIDERVFKYQQLDILKDEVSLLIVGHPYGNYDHSKKNGGQIHPYVIRHLKHNSRLKSPDRFVFLGDLIEQTSFENIRTALKQIYTVTDHPIITVGNHETGDHNLNPAIYFLLWLNQKSSFYRLEWGKTVIFNLNSTKSVNDIGLAQENFIQKTIKTGNFETYVFLSHHVLWLTDSSNDNLVNNGSMFNTKTRASRLMQIIKAINLDQPSSNIIVVGGDLGNKSGFISAKESKNRYFGVGFGNMGSNDNAVGGSSLLLRLNKNGSFSFDKLTIN